MLISARVLRLLISIYNCIYKNRIKDFPDAWSFQGTYKNNNWKSGVLDLLCHDGYILSWHIKIEKHCKILYGFMLLIMGFWFFGQFLVKMIKYIYTKYKEIFDFDYHKSILHL